MCDPIHFPASVTSTLAGHGRYVSDPPQGLGGGRGGVSPGGGFGGGGGGGGGRGGGGGGEGGFRGRKVTTCSFCGKTSRDVGPMVEGPTDVYICANCVDLCQNIFRQERRRVSSARPLFSAIPAPRQIKEFLDQYVIGQEPRQEGALGRRAQPLQALDADRERRCAASRSTRATSC